MTALNLSATTVQNFVETTVAMYAETTKDNVRYVTGWNDLEEWTQFVTDGTNFPYRVNRFTIKRIFRKLGVFEKLNDAGIVVRTVGNLVFMDLK